MNKIKTISTETTTHVKKKISSDKGIFKVLETYEDGVLTQQIFSPNKPFHLGYKPENMSFLYYGRKIDPIKEYDDLDRYKLKPQLLVNLKEFNDFDLLYCNWLGMDHQIYSITNKYPLPTIQHLELWGRYYDLKKASEYLKNISYVKSATLKDNIIQNWDICGTHKLYIKYVPDLKLIKKTVNKHSFAKEGIVKRALGLEQFKIEPKETESYYDD